MLLEEFYIDFLKEHKYFYIFYLFSLVFIPINRVVIPHFYGKLISDINKNRWDSSFKVLLTLVFVWLVSQILNTGSNLLYSSIMPKFVEHFRMKMVDNIIHIYKII